MRSSAAVLAATEGGRRWAEFRFDAGKCHPIDKGHVVWAVAAFAVIQRILASAAP